MVARILLLTPFDLGAKQMCSVYFFNVGISFLYLFLIGREVYLKYLVIQMMKMMRHLQRKELVWIPKGN